MIRRKTIPWKDREHLFTPSNITKFEMACYHDCIYRKRSIHRRTRALRHGPIIWIVRNGKPVNLSLDEKVEDFFIGRGVQLPEDRSGEPDQSYLED